MTNEDHLGAENSPYVKLFRQTCCARCGVHRSFHNPDADAYNPFAKKHCEGFVPIDRSKDEDLWAEDKKWVSDRLTEWLERERLRMEKDQL